MSSGMYSDWKSVEREIQLNNANQTVLDLLPKEVGLDIVKGVASSLNATTFDGGNDTPSLLVTDDNVKWMMQVICYGLALPLSELDTINHCVSIYHNWLSVLYKPRKCVPLPILNNPDNYVKEILHHLYNGFVARDPDSCDPTSASTQSQTASSKSTANLNSSYVLQLQRQTVYCHRTLRNLLDLVVAAGDSLSHDTWTSVLRFLLAINDCLLSPPTKPESLSAMLCTRIVETLFDVWLLACSRCFPSPSMWKTYSEMCRSWRHQEHLILQWSRMNRMLGRRVLTITYGEDYLTPLPVCQPNDISDTEDKRLKILAISEMDNDCAIQTWFRYLHVIGNPNDLTLPNVICNNPKFQDPYDDQPCTTQPSSKDLPPIYKSAMASISELVNAFLGIIPVQTTTPITQTTTSDDSSTVVSRNKKSSSQPPKLRSSTPSSTAQSSSCLTGPATTAAGSGTSATGGGGAATGVGGPGQVRHSSSTDSLSQTSLHGQLCMNDKPFYSPRRPRIDAVLHLFGSWLMEGALVGSNTCSQTNDKHTRSRAASMCLDHNPDISTSNNESQDSTRQQNSITPQHYYEGRSLAIGALCRVFCSHRTGERVSPAYLARFYAILHYALCTNKDQNEIGVLSNTLFNSSDLLRVDLIGVQTLIPRILSSVECVLTDAHNTFAVGDIKLHPLRTSCIQLLISLQCLPLHYMEAEVKGLFNEPKTTYIALQPKVINLIHESLLFEAEPFNTQFLLCSIFLATQDLALYQQQNHPNSLSDKKNNANVYFDKAISLIFNKLNTSWKYHTPCSIAAIQVLCGLAETPIKTSLMCQRAVHWICDLISNQCSRKATSQTKDLHSTICAAFHCLTTWLSKHPALISDRQSLCNLLEVVELGISGAKSQNRPSETPRLKDSKPLRPVSNRVREAAEMTLTTLMDNVGSFPPPCGPESLSSLYDERSLAAKFTTRADVDAAATQFRYYVFDNAIIVGIAEPSSEQLLLQKQEELATVIAIVRGPYGRYAWTMSLRHSTLREDGNSVSPCDGETLRPASNENIGLHHSIECKNFPEFSESIPIYKIKESIPSVQCTQKSYNKDLEFLVDAIQEIEENCESSRSPAAKSTANTPPSTPVTTTSTSTPSTTSTTPSTTTAATTSNSASATSKTTCTAATSSSNPPVCSAGSTVTSAYTPVSRQQSMVQAELKPAKCVIPKICTNRLPRRLNLSHFGWLTADSLINPEQGSSLQPLNFVTGSNASCQSSLRDDLDHLDSLDTRPWDTLHVYYVRKGQTRAADILSNVTSKKYVSANFLSFVKSMGWPVDVRKHHGWTGHRCTMASNRCSSAHTDDLEFSADTGGCLYDGTRLSLYYANCTDELAIVIPSALSVQLFNHFDSAESPSPRQKRTDSTKENSRSTGGSTGMSQVESSDIRILIVWLEVYQDYENFPIDALLSSTETGNSRSNNAPIIFTIYIHAMENQLYRIHTCCSSNKCQVAAPLIDGLVVSHRSLASIVRISAMNTFRRKRLDCDSYQPPAVKRRHAIKNIIDKYKSNTNAPEFYASLLSQGN